MCTRIVRIPSVGLSPHARGNLYVGRTATNQLRSIPACTGEPELLKSGGCVHRVYPRMHGGTDWIQGTATSRAGLSPHARGNRRNCRGRCLCSGSIPACTGEPQGPSASALRGRVYPRMHGGTLIGMGVGEYYSGLSPHARGNPAG